MSTKLEDLVKQQKALQQKIAAERSKAKAAERKKESRKKILIGALILHEVEQNKTSMNEVIDSLDKYLKRDADRAVFGLPPLKVAESNDSVQQPSSAAWGAV